MLDDELIVLHASTGKYHQINKTGKFIFEIISKQEINKEKLLIKLQAKYENNVNINEFNNFLDEMILRDIIVKYEL